MMSTVLQAQFHIFRNISNENQVQVQTETTSPSHLLTGHKQILSSLFVVWDAILVRYSAKTINRAKN